MLRNCQLLPVAQHRRGLICKGPQGKSLAIKKTITTNSAQYSDQHHHSNEFDQCVTTGLEPRALCWRQLGCLGQYYSQAVRAETV
jgi:hypothetical protein